MADCLPDYDNTAAAADWDRADIDGFVHSAEQHLAVRQDYTPAVILIADRYSRCSPAEEVSAAEPAGLPADLDSGNTGRKS